MQTWQILWLTVLALSALGGGLTTAALLMCRVSCGKAAAAGLCIGAAGIVGFAVAVDYGMGRAVQEDMDRVNEESVEDSPTDHGSPT